MKQTVVTVKEIVPFTILREPSALIHFDETPIAITMRPSLEGIKIGDKLYLTIDEQNTMGALVDVEAVK
jgi:hypothetical protein